MQVDGDLMCNYPISEVNQPIGNDSISNELVFFQEKNEVIALVNSIYQENISEDDFATLYENLSKIMIKYLEQSQLLHPHIVDLVQPMNEKLTIILPHFINAVEDLSKVKLNILYLYFGYMCLPAEYFA